MKEKDDRINLLKDQTTELTQQVFDFDKENSTLKIEVEKYTEYYNQAKRDLDEAIEKLHQTNRVRHEVELKLQMEQDTCEELRMTIKEKTRNINERDQKIQWLEDKCQHQQTKIV